MADCELPYIADEATLPTKLPAIEEIESATEIISDTTGRKVVGVGDHFVVKYGVQVDLLEGETMLWLGRSTDVPVPRIYALFSNPDESKKFIVMERIVGTTLESEWSRMDQAAKDVVSSRLRCIFEHMRKLESPGGYCSIGHRGLPDGLFWTNDPTKPYAGPFDTETDLNIAVVAKYVEDGLSKHKADYYSRTFKDVFRHHAPVFSHADFQRKNVMIRSTPAIGNNEERVDFTDAELIIIDWEFAGWYPCYWEYARAVFACGRWDDDWDYWIDEMLEPFRNEYAWVSMLLREMWS